MIDVKLICGAKGDGVADDTAAFVLAAKLSAASRSASIFVPEGEYRITKQLFFATGTNLKADGCVGSNTADGAFLDRDYVPLSPEEGFLNWFGGVPYRGTGGGIHGLSIRGANGKDGGTGVKLLASGPANRPGFFTIDRCKWYMGTGVGKFAIGLLIDGAAAPTPGGAGVRDVTVRDSYIQGCMEAAVNLRYAVHFAMFGGVIDKGGTNYSANFQIGNGCEDVRVIGVGHYGPMMVAAGTRSTRITGCVINSLTVDPLAQDIDVSGCGSWNMYHA